MRATLYSDVNSNPIWDFPTGQYDPFVDISSDGSKIAANAGTHFYLLNPVMEILIFSLHYRIHLYASCRNSLP